MIDESGKNLGVLARDAALALAREKRLDLVEIAPTAKPPVARIMSFDKFRYFEEKKRRKAQVAERGQGSKQIQISGRTAKNDLEIRLRRIEEFLGRGHQVTIVLVLRGREKGHKDWAFQKLKEFLAMIPVPYQMVTEPRVGGRGIVLTINKK